MCVCQRARYTQRGVSRLLDSSPSRERDEAHARLHTLFDSWCPRRPDSGPKRYADINTF